MADSRAAETLRNKRDEIARSIDNYGARLGGFCQTIPSHFPFQETHM